jgi:hypothetical protein
VSGLSQAGCNAAADRVLLCRGVCLPTAAVLQVLSQLSKLCEGDVFEELELLAATDLSNVEYMPAYLNKRLNNKLWSRRKAEGHVPG